MQLDARQAASRECEPAPASRECGGRVPAAATARSVLNPYCFPERRCCGTVLHNFLFPYYQTNEQGAESAREMSYATKTGSDRSLSRSGR